MQRIKNILWHIKAIINGQWTVTWWDFNRGAGFSYVYYDGNHYALSIGIVNFYIYY